VKSVASVAEEVRLIREGSLDPHKIIEEVYRNIRRCERKVNAYITLEGEDIVAEKVEEAVRRGGRLAGIPVAVKDNISTKDIMTTAGSRVLEGYIPPFDATVVKRLKDEGAVIVGKTDLDEFAMGSTTEFSAYGVTRNPWDLSRVAGGSSGGSGAALAYRGCELALGSDTGGIVRLPSAYTATYALKPTYGLVSRYGLIPYANSLEQISPMARSVEDLALLLEVIAGWDPRDSTSLKIKRVRFKGLKPMDFADIRLCVPVDLLELAERGVEREFWRIVERLEGEGSEVSEVRMPWARNSLPAYYTIALAEAASNLARYDGILYPTEGLGSNFEDHVIKARARFGPEVKRRILLGTFVLSEGYRDRYYVAATKMRRLVRDEVVRLALKCTIAVPSSPTLPPRVGERISDPLLLYALDVYNVIANLAGVPALSMPIGFHDGLPVGLQLMAAPLQEERLIRTGLAVEELTGLKGVVADGC